MRCMRTVGLLEQAGIHRLLELPEVIARLRRTNFRIHPTVLDDVLSSSRAIRGRIANQANTLLSHCYAWGAHLSAAHFPRAAHLLVPVTSRAFPRMIRRISPWFPVLPRLVICPSPRGGGSIRSRLDITPSHCAQYAQAQEDQQKTCHHIQAPCTKPCCKMQWEKRPGARHCGGSSGAAPACRWSLPTRSVYRGL
jgi:hypothetical protein